MKLENIDFDLSEIKYSSLPTDYSLLKFNFAGMKSIKLLIAIFSLVILASSCYKDNIKKKPEWSKFFTERGIDSACFEVYDNTHDQVFIYNLDRASRRMTPASTFKIVSSLIALETNIAPDIDYKIKWDGTNRTNENTNQDLDMKAAFDYSATWYFQELLEKIGRDTVQHYLDTLRYGNKMIGDTLTKISYGNDLLVTPDEQVGFLKRMYFDKLPLSKRSQRLVRSLMLHEKNDEYKLSYKTGTADNGKNYICHLVGYLEKVEVQNNVETGAEETNYRPYFFSMSFETKDKNIDFEKNIEDRVAITKDIFRDLEIIK